MHLSNGKIPDSLALVGLGRSKSSFFECLTQGPTNPGIYPEFDEVWTINLGIRLIPHDLVFAMDDFSVNESVYKNYTNLFKEHDKPIMVSTLYPGYPTAIEYPIRDVVKKIGNFIPDNSVIYAMAYALYLGIKKVYLAGCDFSYYDATSAEKGAVAAAFLIGLGKGLGTEFIIPSNSTLMEMHNSIMFKGEHYYPMYGYLKHPLIDNDEIAFGMQKYQPITDMKEKENGKKLLQTHS